MYQNAAINPEIDAKPSEAPRVKERAEFIELLTSSEQQLNGTHSSEGGSEGGPATFLTEVKECRRLWSVAR